MAGHPRRRARREAALIQAGVEPAKWVDDRPMAKPRVEGTVKPPRMSSPPSPAAMAPDVPEELLQLLSSGAVDVLDAETSNVFTNLRAKALAFAERIMDMELDPENRHFAKILSSQQAITTAILTATVRVRPGDLRDKDDDGIGALLAAVKGHAAETDEERAARELLS